MMDEAPSPRPTAAQADIKYLAFVGGLLVLIVAALASLWLMERARRVNAENQLDHANRKAEGLQAVFGQMLTERSQAAIGEAIQRSDLAPKTGSLDGLPVSVFEISASAGRRIGFLPGDVIRVSPERPATSPSTRSDGKSP